jgi:hypothetical protein
MQTQTEIDHIPGRRGATRAAYDPENPMILVRDIWLKRPTADVDEIQRLVRRELKITVKHPARPFIDYAVANLVERIKASERITAPKPREVRAELTPEARREVRKAATIAAQAEAAAQAKILCEAYNDAKREEWRLELVAPNGKPIGDCTGFEASQFSGFWKTIGAGVAADQRIRDIKTGQDVKNAQSWSD